MDIIYNRIARDIAEEIIDTMRQVNRISESPRFQGIVTAKPRFEVQLYPPEYTKDWVQTRKFYSNLPELVEHRGKKGLRLEEPDKSTLRKLDRLRAIERVDYRVPLKPHYGKFAKDGVIELSWKCDPAYLYHGFSSQVKNYNNPDGNTTYFVLYPSLCRYFDRAVKHLLEHEEEIVVSDLHDTPIHAWWSLQDIHQDCKSCPKELKTFYHRILSQPQYAGDESRYLFGRGEIVIT